MPASASSAARGRLRRGRFAPGRPRTGHALEWKDYHFLHGGSAVTFVKWLVCGALVFVTVIAAGSRLYGQEPEEYAGWLFVVGLLGLVAELGFIASRICSTEVRDQTLSSLALLPQSLAQTFRSKADGSWRALAPWPNCMWQLSRICRPPCKARAACTMSRSIFRRRTIRPGRRG